MADVVFVLVLMTLMLLGAEMVRSTCRRQLLKPIGLPQNEVSAAAVPARVE